MPTGKPWEKYGAPAQAAHPALKYQPPLEVESEPLVQPQQRSEIAPMSLDRRAQDVLGIDPNLERTTILPRPMGSLPSDKKPLDWTDWVAPQIAVDMAKSFLLPGHAAQGGEFTPEDAVKFTLDYGLPATQMRPKPKRMGKRQIIREAPDTQELAEKGGKLLEAAKNSGVSVDPADATSLVQNMASRATKEGLDDTLHPMASAALKAVDKRLATSQDMSDLMIARRQIGAALQRSASDDERRLLNIMQDTLDDFVDNSLPEASAQAQQGRKLWAQMKKAQTVEDIIEKAKLQSSGFENGVRVGFRALLNNPKKARAFTPEEQKLMRQIVKGTAKQNMLRTLGRLSFGRQQGSNFLGGSIGVAGGASIAGPAGAAAAPIIGDMARRAAQADISLKSDLIRALAAGGTGGTQNVMRPPIGAGGLAGALMNQNQPVRRLRPDET